MTSNKINIDPNVTVHDMLEAFPELEDVLIGIAPPFKKLKNPLLRRSVAKVATLKHVASVGRVSLNELIIKLRLAVGQPVEAHTYDDENYFGPRPGWFSKDRIEITIDEDKLEEKDRMTLVVILTAAKELKQGGIIELVTTFLPAPGIDVWRSKGFEFWSVVEERNLVKTYFFKG